MAYLSSLNIKPDHADGGTQVGAVHGGGEVLLGALDVHAVGSKVVEGIIHLQEE